jgi:hypothetical protein
MTRSQAEIVDRFNAADDFFGFAIEVLSESMTADTIRSINPGAELPDDWAPQTAEQITASGISAERSVIKLREYAWLLGQDEVVAAMDAADYPQYGAPKTKAFADGMGWGFIAFVEEADKAALVRMSNGLPCTDDCESGCGQ